MKRKRALASGRRRARHRSGPRTLTIDVGGTGLKAAILDLDGRMVSDRVRVPTPAHCPPAVLVRAMTDLVAFLSWILHATRLTWPELQVLYDVYGEARVPEPIVDHLEGYARSAPVRAGNAAMHQLQLDIYGEVVDAAWRYVERGGRLDRATARTLRGFDEVVIRRWREPDEGIWEPRSGRRRVDETPPCRYIDTTT